VAPIDRIASLTLVTATVAQLIGAGAGPHGRPRASPRRSIALRCAEGESQSSIARTPFANPRGGVSARTTALGGLSLTTS
jgi:hypothetical protein